MMSREAAIETARQFAETFTSQLVIHASRIYNIPEEDITPKIRISASPRFRTSRGGASIDRPFMSLVIGPLLNSIQSSGIRNCILNFSEYDHIEKDPDIGALHAIGWQQYLAALIAHEFAHVIQFCGISQKAAAAKHNIPASKMQTAAHGLGWQQIYREFRIKFVNGRAFREINIAPVKVRSADKPKQTRATPKRSFSAVSSTFGSGKIITYFDQNKVIIGQLFSRGGHYISYYDPIARKWIPTKIASVVEARKEIFGI